MLSYLIWVYTCNTIAILVKTFWITGLINARNHLSRYYDSSGDSVTMPGLLKDKHVCKFCPCIKECMLYHWYVYIGVIILLYVFCGPKKIIPN